jgi:hypothetical protein
MELGMEQEGEGISYSELGVIAEEMLEEAEEDVGVLVRVLESLPPKIRADLFSSDFLNAYQVFYYFYREEPGELEKDRLILQPASALKKGVLLTEIDLLEIVFRVDEEGGVISVSDGEQVLVNFRGRGSYDKAVRFIDENL